MSEPGNGLGEFLTGADGRPLRDRYGRPIRRRTSAGASSGSSGRHHQPQQFDAPARQVPPRSSTPRPADRGSYRADPPARSGSNSSRDYRNGYQEPYRQSHQEPPRQQYQQYQRYQRSARPPQGEPYRPPQGEPYREAQRAPAGRQVGPYQQRPGQPRYAAAPEPRARSSRRRFRITGRGIALTLAVIVVLSLCTGLFIDARLNRVEAMPSQHAATGGSGTNWLLVGSDSREGLTEEEAERLGTGGDIGVGRTDTVMLLHVPLTGGATLVSLPRDSYVSIPGYGMDKLNASFSYGGPELLIETVEGATNLHIDHYAEIGMGGLATVVDAVGGVEVCPTEAIDDPLASLNIQAGCQTVDGATALGYVRTRATANGDLDRVVRQREFFSALLSRMTSVSTLLNPFRAWPMVSRLTSSFTVGEGDHLWHLLRVPFAMKNVETETVPVGGFATYDVGDVVLWDEGQATALFQSLR